MEKTILEERKKTIYQFICDEFYVPMKAKEMAVVLSVPKSQRSELQEVLDALVMDGRIEVTSKGKYIKSEGKYLIGTFTAHARGFGFVSIEGEEEDIFIPESQVHGAFHMDTVQVAVTSENSGKRREGTITKIISRGTTRIVCTYEKSKTFGFAVPDNPKFGSDIFIPQERSKGAVSGHKVVVEITDYGKEGRKPEGKVVEIIGHINDPGTDIMSIVKAYDLPVEFSEKIMHQVENVSNEVSTADMAGRMDFRDWQTVTIDGEDAKDLDDAITLTKEGDNYKLGVHIADVSNYVQEHSALDVEALSRGTSVYLVDRVIPMLPHRLSNGICSLNAGYDRLAMSCLMDIDEKGIIVGHKICESVVNIDRRMTYTAVNAILEAKNGKNSGEDAELEETNGRNQDERFENDEQKKSKRSLKNVQADDLEKKKDAAKEKAEFAKKCLEEYEDFVPMFLLLDETARVLREKRMARGAVDFDFPECKIILDAKGRPVEIKPYERNAATMLIEDCMLAANETVAEDYYWQQAPFLYRSHEKPDGE